MTQPVRVLILEDEVLIALDLAVTLEEHGFGIVGPFRSVAEALETFDSDRPSVGILDVNLSRGETSLPLAARFREAGIPFLFLTGYDVSGAPALGDFKDVPRIAKPFQTPIVLKAIAKAMA